MSEKLKYRQMPGACAHHTPVDKDPYTFLIWAKAQDRKGIKQTQCADCSLWFYPQEVGKKP